ncbi:FdhF/YdeP family oxidoreductase [Alteromonas sp. 5E99-2]|uniref:FdhF/YdeP family oxidoreductase n=1 Tax=Alteromonas sp. 5E99-2 TaxID=2817683 RepID=UPI001A97E550|nr:FdhF/YdeP family oxidoreductase [Alteromonas sp. 5E99-2]MBO1254367.1 FdhF/YdeP family oxidoreductase [Alteromonas sp. 5E99-2]
MSQNKAGGLPSLKSTASSLLRSKRVKQNIKNLLKVNQTDGFDCPGCAWGDDKTGRFKFCENGAKAVAWESTDLKVGAEFFAQYSVSELMQQSDHWLESQGRLAQPVKYNKSTDHYEPITWEKAFQFVATAIQKLSPNQIEFYTSGRASNEAAFLYQLFARSLGTNNFPDCSNMCHEASGVALTESIGIGKGTVTLDDFNHADAIFVFGQNPGTNHPRMMNALRKAARNNCTIVSVNNLKEVALERFASPQDPIELLTPAATTISHLYLTPKLGGDFALVRGMVKALVEQNTAFNTEFIESQTQGVDDYLNAIKGTSWSLIEAQSGIDKASIFQAAELFSNAKRVISTWAMGLTQHKHSVIAIQEIINLHLLFGQIGQKGAGLCPVRGHSNVQGNRTVGINEKPPMAFLNTLEKATGQAMPKAHGHNVVQALKALHSKQSKALICLGGNLAAAASDTLFTFDAIRQGELLVNIATKLNRTHLLVSENAVILPCLGRTEIDMQASGPQVITVEDTFSMVHGSKGSTPPEGLDCLSETAIVGNLAQATLGNKLVDWLSLVDDYSRIRDLIEKTVKGFNGFNSKIAQPGGFYLGNSAREFNWQTQSGKAQFSASSLPESVFDDALEAAIQAHKSTVFTLQTLRSHDQYNTTIYGLDDRYRGIKQARDVVFINESDAKKLNMSDGQKVTLTAVDVEDGGIPRLLEGFTLVFYDIPQGNLAAYYPETNILLALDNVGDRSFTPTSKSIPVILTA